MRVGLLVLLAWLVALPVAAQSITGTVEHVWEDYPTHAIERKFLVLPDGTRLRLKGVNDWTHGKRVRVDLRKVRGKAHTLPEHTQAEVSVADVEVVEEPTIRGIIANVPIRIQKVDVIPVYWDATVPYQVGSERVRGTATDTNRQYNLFSYGLFQFEYTFHAPVQVTKPADGTCPYSTFGSEARTKALARGDVFPTGTFVQFYFQELSCGWAGLTSGNTTYLNGGRASGHELGHALGLQHSGAENWYYDWTGAEKRPTNPYGNYCDMMGHSQWDEHHFIAQKKIQLGWLTPDRVTQSGTYTIEPMETISSGPKMAVIQAKYAFSSTMPADHHFEYRTICPGSPPMVMLSRYHVLADVDVTPEGTKGFFLVGETFTAWDNSFTLTVKSLSPTAAVVDVQFKSEAFPPSNHRRQ